MPHLQNFEDILLGTLSEYFTPSTTPFPFLPLFKMSDFDKTPLISMA
jgi:hypothetical protein